LGALAFSFEKDCCIVIGITDAQMLRCNSVEMFGGGAVQENTLERAICKLAIAGEQAGFSVEQMIDFLNAGLTVEGLLDLITFRLGKLTESSAAPAHYSGWIV
jgi:hypothetical protein